MLRKQTVEYFNDSKKSVSVYVDTLYDENMVLLKPLERGIFELDVDDNDIIVVKTWGTTILISRWVDGITQDIPGKRPDSQKKGFICQKVRQ